MFCLLAVASSLLVAPHEERSFLQFMRDHGQFFTGDEYHFRLGVYLTNLRYVQEHNARGSSFKLGMNSLAVLTPSEYRAMLTTTPSHLPLSGSRKSSKLTKSSAPVSFDWREKNVVSEIQDQGQCNSAWAFACSNAAESNWAIDNSLIKFSAQHLLDCTDPTCDCTGGYAALALFYVLNGVKYFMKESDYPYTGVQGTCQFDESKGVARLTGYWQVNMHDEVQGIDYLSAYGPSMNMIDATQVSFQLYAKGIYDEPKCNKDVQSHNVGLVGYGVEGDVKYWIVRNTWGAGWGESGYIRMVRDKGDQCGLANYMLIPSYD